MKRFQHRAVIAPHGSGGRSPRGAALALSLSLIMLITAGPVTAGEWGKVDLQQSTEDWVKNCGIFSFMDMETFGFFYVYSGPDDDDTFRYDLCARGQIDMGFGDRNARAPADAPDLTDVALIAPKIILGRKSRTSECVYDVGGLDTSANPTPKFVCPEQTVFNPAGVADALPDLTKFKQALPFPAISSAGADKVVPAKGTEHLLPGDYGHVVVGEKGRLVFEKAGNYNFKSIRSVTDRDPMYVEFKEPKTTVNVVDYLLLGHRTEWNNAATPTIKVYVAGAGPYDVPKWSPTEVAFRMKGDGHFHSCWVYSPNGTQIWEGHSHEGEGESGPDMDAPYAILRQPVHPRIFVERQVCASAGSGMLRRRVHLCHHRTHCPAWGDVRFGQRGRLDTGLERVREDTVVCRADQRECVTPARPDGEGIHRRKLRHVPIRPKHPAVSGCRSGRPTHLLVARAGGERH
jgi:hypothetical protein